MSSEASWRGTLDQDEVDPEQRESVDSDPWEVLCLPDHWSGLCTNSWRAEPHENHNQSVIFPRGQEAPPIRTNWDSSSKESLW